MGNFRTIAEDEDYIRLDSMEEIGGYLESMEKVDNSLLVRLTSGTLRFPADSHEAAICRQNLAGDVGKWISILRGPFSEQPIVVSKSSEE